MTVQSEAWKFYGVYGEADYPSMREGIFAVKALDGGKWKWNTKSPGNGTSRALFVCNAHNDCAKGEGKHMRCVLLGGQFSIQYKGEHGEEASLKKRGNSSLTWQQTDDVSMMMATGAKAGAMHTVMTNGVAEKYEEAGEDPLAYKLPDGGIEKVCVQATGHGHPSGHHSWLTFCHVLRVVLCSVFCVLWRY